jgi:two-component system response regulator FixJ
MANSTGDREIRVDEPMDFEKAANDVSFPIWGEAETSEANYSYSSHSFGGGPMERKIIHVIDDDPAVLDSLELLLITEGFAVQAHPSARHFLDSASGREAACVLTDMRMPGLSGIDLLSVMNEQGFSAPVIIMTAHADVALALEAKKLGAFDLLEKPCSNDSLLSAVQNAFACDKMRPASRGELQGIRENLAKLTGRENDVLQSLLEGKPNKAIADQLGLSLNKVETLRASIMAKTGKNSLPELVRAALAVRP